MIMTKKDVLKGRSIVGKNVFDQANKSIDEIKRANPIVDYFKSRGVKLKSTGNGQLMGLCPFHNDTNPSLSVNSEKNVFKCFGCGKSGTVIDAVSLFENISAGEAIKRLQNEPLVITEELFPTLTSPEEANGNQPEIDLNLDLSDIEEPSISPDQPADFDLNRIADYYHRKLFENRKAQDYLTLRGLNDPELIGRYRIGFCDGSLLNVIGGEQKKELTQAGILHEKGFETFSNCITFPIFNDQEQVAGLYGRNIDDTAKVKHLYLKGKHRGIWNRKASKVYDEIILTESIIDALSLIRLGMQNVQPCYGVNGFTDIHLTTWKEDRVKTVVIAFDNDDAGIKVGEQLRDRLTGEGFMVKVIFPPPSVSSAPIGVNQWNKDWNEELLNGLDLESVKKLVEKAEVFRKEEPEEKFTVERIPSGCRFRFGDVSYEVLNFKDDYAGALKVILKAEYRGRMHCDDFNLYGYRGRENFIRQSEYLTGIPAGSGTDQITAIIQKLEEIRNKKLSGVKEAEQEEQLTEEEIRIGMDFLTNPDQFDELKEDLDSIGCVGENKGKVLLYLVATSRLRSNPIPVYVLGRSSGGKSYLVKTVLKLIPEKEKFIITKVSPEVIYYMEKGLKHKVVMVGEFDGAEDIEYLLREMVSDGKVSKLVTLKDSETGLPKPFYLESEGPIRRISTSTKPEDLNPENLNRCILMHVDESPEQTQRILEYQRFVDSREGFIAKARSEAVIRKHHIVQRLLEDITVFNTFGDELDFPTLMLLSRRAHFNFLRVIDMVAFQLQKLHPAGEMEMNGKTVRYIETDIRDYTIAYNLLMDGIMENTLDEMSVNAKNLHKIMLKLVAEIADQERKPSDTVYLERKQIMAYSGWTAKQVRTAVRVLLDYGYLEVVAGKDNGKTHKYRVLNITSRVGELLKKIPSPEEMKKRLSAKGKL